MFLHDFIYPTGLRDVSPEHILHGFVQEEAVEIGDERFHARLERSAHAHNQR